MTEADILMDKLKKQIINENKKYIEFKEEDYYILIDYYSLRKIMKENTYNTDEVLSSEAYIRNAKKAILGIETLVTGDMEGIELVRRLK